MTHEQLLEMLQPTGIPWAYHHWEKPPTLPRGVYIDLSPDIFYADNSNFFVPHAYRLELYSLQRDPALDDRVHNVLCENGITYTFDFLWIESEGLYETIFEFEV